MYGSYLHRMLASHNTDTTIHSNKISKSVVSLLSKVDLFSLQNLRTLKNKIRDPSWPQTVFLNAIRITEYQFIMRKQKQSLSGFACRWMSSIEVASTYSREVSVPDRTLNCIVYAIKLAKPIHHPNLL